MIASIRISLLGVKYEMMPKNMTKQNKYIVSSVTRSGILVAFSYSFTKSLSDKNLLPIYNFEFLISNFLNRFIDLRHHLFAFFHTAGIFRQIRMVLQRKIMICFFDLFVGSSHFQTQKIVVWFQ